MTRKNKSSAPAGFGMQAGSGADATKEKFLTAYHTPADPNQQIYCDRYGHRHTAAVFDHWHPQVIAFMGIRQTGGCDHEQKA